MQLLNHMNVIFVEPADGGLRVKRVAPISVGVQAKPHRPVYRMHRYFARRPYSVFAALVSHYSKPGDVVLDPFCGGGVSVVEAAIGGRVGIGYDVNPLATFITRTELEPVDLDELKAAAGEVAKRSASLISSAFATSCRACSAATPAAWFEHSARTTCPGCGETFLIADAEKLRIGTWACPACGGDIRFSPDATTVHQLVQVHYTCETCGDVRTTEACDFDTDKRDHVSQEFRRAAADGLWMPTLEIPDCNMQRESALHKKGIVHFHQLFTDRHLYALSHLRQVILDLRSPLEDFLLLAFSSTLRYTNRMVTRNPGWRGDRPLEWAKPGFWLPPVHVEANVLVEFERRCEAVIRGKRDYERLTAHLEDPPRFSVKALSATNLPLDDGSVDLVLTDPPYGSYVHYADLCNFWSAWLPERLGLGRLIDTTEEAVIARKRFPGSKTARDYARLLESSFRECHRVLKPGAYMVLTFHNREPRAWAALFLAAVKAGFELPPGGVIFQDGVPSYKHTAQSRRTGSAIGDFIISFVRPLRPSARRVAKRRPLIDEDSFVRLVEGILEREGPLPPPRLMALLWIEAQQLLFAAARQAASLGDDAERSLLDELDQIQMFDSHRRSMLEAHFDFDGAQWSLRRPV